MFCVVYTNFKFDNAPVWGLSFKVRPDSGTARLALARPGAGSGTRNRGGDGRRARWDRRMGEVESGITTPW